MYHFLLKFIIFFITIYLSLKYRSAISQSIKLIDYPDKRKDHKLPTPLIGGLISIILITEYFLYNFFFNLENIEIAIYFLSLTIFIIGLIDDIKNIPPWIRLVAIFSIFFIFFIFFSEHYIKNLNFILGKTVHLKSLSIIFSVLCMALLINAFNMTDGINGLFLGISIICFSYIFFSYPTNNTFLFFMITILIVLLFLNIKNFFFMGDSGVYLITTILGISIISAYNSKLSNIKSVEEIFLLFCIPGIDMFRLFIIRILNKKNPFKGDKNHFHHLLKNRIGSSWSIVVYFLLILIGLLLKYINISIGVCILILLTIYFYLLWYLKRK